MYISLGLFQILVWGSIAISAILMITVFGYFVYELKQKSIW
ncbi:hypothetical protein [Alteribacillus iranensis]|uniref:Uncharacterized protein n=1 Tax=Alteribacillus iranensis TaxID=930128 RepID=A0A1I2BIH1_9BACI|nr:hypothetical protein [Alteribacillus iranensis]SFE55985.1 hypothetical protein SAMN05192532_102325 [Alteribacillus iranensis]